MRNLVIATGNRVSSTHWVNESITWDDLCKRLSNTIKTAETVEEYKTFTKEKKNDAKDHGGFVGGKLKGTSRKNEEVQYRSLITLDMDHASIGFLDKFKDECKYTCCLYSTHSHRPEAPRYRLIFPLTRDIDGDEYVAISRYLAAELGIEQFDKVSFVLAQLMFWPSTSKDGVFKIENIRKSWLNPDDFLIKYPNYKDLTSLPKLSKEEEIQGCRQGKKQKDPLTKEGIVGAFCRCFPIYKAIDYFLSDIYEEVEENRYHFIGSSSAAGALAYDDKFFYSHHSTDPVCGKLLNSYDLVRLHLFGEDKDSNEKMRNLALQQDEVKLELAISNASAEEDFKDVDKEWMSKLSFGSNGQILNNSTNIDLILSNDSNLVNFAFNELAGMVEVTGPLPWARHGGTKFWRDADDAQLLNYLELRYGHFSVNNYMTGFTVATENRSFHPLKKYLDSLPQWDGVKRVEDIFIKQLEADDNDYIKEVTRKWFAAAVARIYHPGIKFDSLIVLDGKQGVGKSTLIRKLIDEDYFSDSLQLSDMDNNKNAGEKLQGCWIMEIQELAGMKKADIEKVKGFISTQDDRYRASYARRVEWHRRQCVLFATVNGERGYLRDLTGNRRFWIVNVNKTSINKNYEFSKEFKDQFWAEAKYYFESGEKLYLEGKFIEISQQYQNKAMEHDERTGLVREYLSKLLPSNWTELSTDDRRNFFNSIGDFGPFKEYKPSTLERTEVTNMEIWCECLGKNPADLTPRCANEIAMIMQQIEGWEKTNKIKSFGPYGRQKYYSKK